MSIQLNHTIVNCRDQERSAAFLSEILGLPPATRFAHFLIIKADNDVSLDFAETTGAVTPQHYAFLVSEVEFDAAYDRIRQQTILFGGYVAGYVSSYYDEDGNEFERSVEADADAITARRIVGLASNGGWHHHQSGSSNSK